MYEEKTKKNLSVKNLNMDWKSLFVKFAILLVVVFIVLLIISLVKKDKKALESNLSVNLQSMKTAAHEYFTGSRLPSNVNGRKKITLGEMFENKLLVEFKDQNNKSCDTIGSFAEATKINSTDYTIKVKLVCSSESNYIIDTIKVQDDNVDVPNDNDDIQNDNNQTNTDNNISSGTSNNNSTSKPNSKPSTSNKNPITNITTKPGNSNNSTSTTSCTYGNKDYTSSNPLAYIIPGNCAVSKSDYYKAEYANKVSSISAVEYKKLNDELISLKNNAAGNLYIENPSYYGVYNKSGEGLVGYQILFTMKQKVNYVTTTIYQYYLNENGTRTVVIDKRDKISNSNGNNNSTIRVNSVSLNKKTLDLDVDDTYYLVATINPSNATNKKITWSSSNSRVASVNSSGKVTALREGSATIIATVDGKSATTKVYVYEEQTTRYCKLNKERVYSTGYISQNELAVKDNYRYQVILKTNNTNVYDIEYGNLSSDMDYYNAYNYWANKNKPLYSTGTTASAIDPKSPATLKSHSLRAYNFAPTVSYVRKSGNELYFNIYIKLKNLNNIDMAMPYYTASNNKVYFVPLYFDVTTIDYNNCRNITSSQVDYYVRNGYAKAN